MNKRDLVLEALQHKKSGPVPYAINLTGAGYDAYGERLIEDYASDQVKGDYRKGLLNLQEAVSLGIGNHILHVSAPWWQWHKVPDYFFTDYDAPEILPDTIGRGNYESYFAKLEYLRQNYDVYLLNTVWGSHWEKAYFARGIENFLADLAGSPAWAQSLLDLIIRKNLVMLENFLAAPELDGVLLGSDWGTQNDLIMSPECFRTMIKPGEQQEYDLIRRYDKHIFVHSCGSVSKILPDLVEMGLQVLNPVQPECMDIADLKQRYGAQLSFYGGISTQRTLPYGTPQEVQRETESVIALLSEQGGYITASSQEIQTDVPYDNLRALIDTAIAHA